MNRAEPLRVELNLKRVHLALRLREHQDFVVLVAVEAAFRALEPARRRPARQRRMRRGKDVHEQCEQSRTHVTLIAKETCDEQVLQ